jgi:LemA protein
MKGTRNLTLLIAGGVLLILFFWGCNVRNTLATSKKGIDGAWGQVENKYGERMRLYDNVVATIKGSARFEDTVLTNIVKMRSKVPNLEQNNAQTLADANRQLDQIKGTILNINIEAYPNLKTPDAFKDFQVQIGRMEAMLSTAIMDWNNGVTAYNQKLVIFPNNLVAGMFGYKELANYKTDEAAKNKTVDFSK